VRGANGCGDDMMMRSVIILMQTGCCWLSSTDAFVTRHLTGTQWSHSSIRQYSFFQDWESISRGDRGVWKQTMVKGTSDRTIPKNSTFEIKYKGFLLGEDWWTPRDVIVKILDKTARYLASPGIAWLRRNEDRYT
jgi:hypothetical protein